MSAVIRIVDFETTGMEPPAQVIEVGICDLRQMDDGWEITPPRSWLCGVSSVPPEIRAIHHISAAETIGLTPFEPESLLIDLPPTSASVFAAHNAEFEMQFFQPAIPMLCTYKAALRVWPEAPRHNNQALRYWLEDQGLIRPDPALCLPPHRAAPDAYVTAHLLKALLETTTGREMVAWTKEPRLLPTIPIGKQRGAKWADVDAGFLNWMLKQDSMEADLKWNAQRELERRRAA
jgi:exodeoxyribonuclease X